MREGPLCVGLCHAQGPHHQADDPREDHRSVARSQLGRSAQLRGLGVPPHSGEAWPRFDRRHHVVALHERRNVSGAEARARRVRQQQRRHLRARVPLADRLWPEDHARRIGRHADFRVGRQGRRHHGDRRESDRRPSGVRLAPEAPRSRRREADRGRSAPHRYRRYAAREGVASSAIAAGHERRDRQCARPCDRDRRPAQRSVHRRALRHARVRSMARVCRAAGKRAGSHRGNHRRACRTGACSRAHLRAPAATPRSTTASASPNTRKARPW